MLERNSTVNKDPYIAQLHHVNEAIQQKRPGRQGGRKKGETKSILEERHKARLEEQEMKLIEEGVRRSQSIKDRNDANLIMEIDHYIPENFKEAMDSGERNEWHKAMEEELSLVLILFLGILCTSPHLLTAALTQVGSTQRTETDLPPFDGTYAARQFFQVYDRKMDEALVTTPDKLLRLPSYLTRQPLELFRKLRLATQSYFQVRQTLMDLYPESNEASFAKYFAMKLAGQAVLEKYYREKIALGMQLGLPQEVILETLKEGLPLSDQRLVRVVPPESLGEWFQLVQRIHGPSAPRAHTPAHPEEQVRGLHLLRRRTVNSAAPIIGTVNADINQLNTRARGQCKQPHIHHTPYLHHKARDKPPETPQPLANQV
ncbi:hypothetical protein LAZ67_9002070 [Cordylochernes scorpioides]|uniref:Uncharacterized protein n=1 Tax=Cordylochernes scorpioides TaxID=51811 RepID=A0ABY6KTI5_9ARAC|nr:hypothetical protein LAZ67_9002070 [Cordylochernes scorpioides]